MIQLYWDTIFFISLNGVFNYEKERDRNDAEPGVSGGERWQRSGSCRGDDFRGGGFSGDDFNGGG